MNLKKWVILLIFGWTKSTKNQPNCVTELAAMNDSISDANWSIGGRSQIQPKKYI